MNQTCTTPSPPMIWSCCDSTFRLRMRVHTLACGSAARIFAAMRALMAASAPTSFASRREARSLYRLPDLRFEDPRQLGLEFRKGVREHPEPGSAAVVNFPRH